MKTTAGWAAATLSIVGLVCAGLTGSSLAGWPAVGLAVVAAAIYLDARISRAVSESTSELADCIDGTIGESVEFGRQSERRRQEARAPLASVRPLAPRRKP